VRPPSISLTQRFKRLLSICAICAIGVAGAAASHAEGFQPSGGIHPHGPEVEPSASAHALSAVAGTLDESAREAAERTGRAEATGGREARGSELRGGDDE